MSVIMVVMTYNNVSAQTLESITEQRKVFETSPQIMVGDSPKDIGINDITNKIYSANKGSDSVSIIDSNSGNAAKDIRVGAEPLSIAVDRPNHKIYVANSLSNTVSVIDGDNDTKITDIPVGKIPIYLATGFGKIYVANAGSNTVSVINGSNHQTHDILVGKHPTYITPVVSKVFKALLVANADNNTISVINVSNDKKLPIDIPVGRDPTYIATGEYGKIYVANSLSNTVSVINLLNYNNGLHDIPVGRHPTYIAYDYTKNKIYVANSLSNTVSVIDGDNDTKITDIPVGKIPTYLVLDYEDNKIYVLNRNSSTVSVINGSNYQTHTILVGKLPSSLAINYKTRLIYVANEGSNSVSVINGFSDKVAAGVRLNISPTNSGQIICNAEEDPTNMYLYMDTGTKCIAQPNTDFKFSSWVENLNRNSTLPLGNSSGPLTVSRYGTFTAYFTTIPPAIPPQYQVALFGIMLGTFIPSIFRWVNGWWQRKHLREWLDVIEFRHIKFDRIMLEKKILDSYTRGRISDSHYATLRNEISKHYSDIESE
jgi:YVTN family beta-propeller protein